MSHQMSGTRPNVLQGSSIDIKNILEETFNLNVHCRIPIISGKCLFCDYNSRVVDIGKCLLFLGKI